MPVRASTKLAAKAVGNLPTLKIRRPNAAPSRGHAAICTATSLRDWTAQSQVAIGEQRGKDNHAKVAKELGMTYAHVRQVALGDRRSVSVETALAALNTLP